MNNITPKDTSATALDRDSSHTDKTHETANKLYDMLRRVLPPENFNTTTRLIKLRDRITTGLAEADFRLMALATVKEQLSYDQARNKQQAEVLRIANVTLGVRMNAARTEEEKSELQSIASEIEDQAHEILTGKNRMAEMEADIREKEDAEQLFAARLRTAKYDLRVAEAKSLATSTALMGAVAATIWLMYSLVFPLYLAWMQRAQSIGLVAGVLSIILGGIGLYKLRVLHRRLYAVGELSFALLAGIQAVKKIQDLGDTASVIQATAAIYLVVRGLDNFSEGQKKLRQAYESLETTKSPG
ncbi:hypothetical protein OV207_12870 [Corallococcus sp. BB11-1]|uniref:hypothetical protein n=1 Tax=Corallococcus sp. BB11-1 TaxID=2996783 RepID=UPI00226F771D|nr:hypothetical protein [Corallococcus sp. BB11-1]MCY1032356.1 hypothetical protein [Corallococcus sp. BB11-1]